MINFIEVINGLKDYIQSSEPLDTILIAVNESKAEITNRIFNSEKGTKDVKGTDLKAYSKEYAKYRQSLGRQIKNVDLELTGSLRRNLKTVRRDKNFTIQFDSQTEISKIKDIEKKYNKVIFDSTEEETNNLVKKVNEYLLKDLARVIEEKIKK